MIWKGIKVMLIVNKYSYIDKKLMNSWNDLWQKSSSKTFFNSYDWFRICLQTFNYQQYLIITVEENNNLIAILPLVKKKTCFVSPGERYLDNTTLLIKNASENIIPIIIEFIQKNKFQVILNEVGESLSKYFQSIPKTFSSNNQKKKKNKSIENIIKHKELRYLKRIMEKNKEHICFSVYKGLECYEQIERIFEIEKESNKPQLKKDIFRNQKARILFKYISKTNNSLLIILKYNNMDIAHLFSLVYDKTVMAYHMAYNKYYSSLQPGKLIFIHLMEYMLENNLQILDFSRGDSILKRHFSNDSTKKYNLYINCNIFIRIKAIVQNFIYYIKGTKIYKRIKKIIKRK